MPYPPFTKTCHFFGDIRHAEYLRPFCRACRRQGRYSVAGLIERYGADYPILLWKSEFHRGCPKWVGGGKAPCSVLVDELIRQWQGMGPKGLDEEPL